MSGFYLALIAAPIIVFSRPTDCRIGHTDFCAEVTAALAHPAMQRRLESVTFTTENADSPSLAVKDPGGVELIRWNSWVSRPFLSDVLHASELASRHLDEAHRARTAGEESVVKREWALALLAFGDEARGRALLEELRASDSIENRQLAAIWLERLAKKPREAILLRHAREGASDRVRFEAWMALGDIRPPEQAIEAYDRASRVAAPGVPRSNALTARQRAISLSSPVLGLAPPGSVTVGRRSITPRGLPRNTASVEYRVDGKPVVTARRKPFAVYLKFGRIPTRHVLEVVARDRGGNVLERSSVVINERAEAFDVDIVPVDDDAVIAVRVPDGRSVEAVIVEADGVELARFTKPPYRIRRPVDAGVLRAVLRLDDGSEVEDVFLGTGTLEAEAHLIEIPVYFEGSGEVTVREAGKHRTVERIIKPAEAPLLAALLIDSSGSMEEHLLDVQEAALRFVEQHVDARDRVMVAAFRSTTRVLQRPTGDLEQIERAVLALRPQGATKLYDAITHALLQIQSTGSRKALIVFSDGLDTDSFHSAADAIEIARRTGVPVYPIVLFHQAEILPDMAAKVERARKDLLSLGERTGGKAFELRSLDQLGTFFAEIGADLSKQSLLVYRTETAGAEWRKLEVTVKRGRVRAPSGVYVSD